MLDKYILIEKLLQSNPSIAKQLIQDELEQLDINSEEKIKEIVLQKK